MKVHDEGAPPREFKIDITKEEQELANELLNPEKPQLMRKVGITQSALKTPRVGRENYDQVIFDPHKGKITKKICEFGENYLIRGAICSQFPTAYKKSWPMVFQVSSSGLHETGSDRNAASVIPSSEV